MEKEGCGQVVDLDVSTHLLVEELELSGVDTPPTTNVATQTEVEWPAERRKERNFSFSLREREREKKKPGG